MQAAPAQRGDSSNFLIQFVGSGLEDDQFVVEQYLSQADGDIVPVDVAGVRPKGRRKSRLTLVLLKAVVKLRPARDEVNIATGIKLRNCGVQLWGWRVMGIFVERGLNG